MLHIVALGICTSVISYVCYVCRASFVSRSLNKKTESLDLLKNALLAHAIVKARSKDIDHNNMNYKSFDGKNLPMMSGCDMTNACFSYIINKEDFRKGPWYSPFMEDKIDAIEKYLEINFDTNEKALAFFNEYVRALENKHI